MNPLETKWHHHFNWSRIFLVVGILAGLAFTAIAVHNVTGIQCAKAAVAAAAEGATPQAAAEAAGPEDSTLNWSITITSAVIGVLSTLLGLLKALQATQGQSVIEKIKAATQVQNVAAVAMLQDGPDETPEVLLAKLQKACESRAQQAYQAALSSVNGGK